MSAQVSVYYFFKCDLPQDFSHFGDDTRTTRSQGNTKKTVQHERSCQDLVLFILYNKVETKEKQ